MENNMGKIFRNEDDKKKETLNNFLEEEFEQTFGYLKDKMNESEFLNFKNKWINNETEEACKLEDFNAMHEETLGKMKKERVDLITRLEKEKAFFSKLNQKAGEYLGISTETSAEGWVEKFLEKSEDLKSQDLNVMAADVSYLNIVNSISHNEGDKMLSKLGTSFLNHHEQIFRLHGDEFAGIFETTKEEAEKKMKEIEEDFRQQKIDELRGKYDLEPEVDWAVVSFNEAVEVFKRVLRESEVKKMVIQRGRLIKTFVNAWHEIADIKALNEKARKRIPLLVEKYEERPDLHQDFVCFLYKGAYNITQQKVAEFEQTKSREGEGEMMKEVESFIADREKEVIEGLRREELEAEEKGDIEESQIKKFERVKREVAIEL
ncbi:MAG: diguanylate cyclase [Candidatus Moraniibacteriota bacterium]